MFLSLLAVGLGAAILLIVLAALLNLARRAALDRKEHWSWFHPGAVEDTAVLARLPRHRIDTVEHPFRLAKWRKV